MKRYFVIALLAVAVCLASSSVAWADIYNWQTSQVIPGTEGITPAPGIFLTYWNTPSHNLQYADFRAMDLDASSFWGSWLDYANFSNADLPGAYIGDATLAYADFSNANLTSVDFMDSTLTDANLSNANLAQAYFLGATLTGANLSSANLTKAYLAGATLDGTDLTDAIVAGASFGTDITREQLYSTASYKAKDLTGIGLYYSNMTGYNLAGQNLTDANLEVAVLTDVDLTDAIVVDADFSRHGSDGRGSGLTVEQLYSTASYKAKNLTGIGLAGSALTGCNLAGQNLTGTNFSWAELTGVDLTDAIVANADFSRCDIRYYPNLYGSGITKEQLYSTAGYKAKDLTGIGLSCNDLEDWDLIGQDLRGAHFKGATLTGVDLTDAIVTHADFNNYALYDFNVIGINYGGTGITKEQLYATASYKARDLQGIGLSGDLTGCDLAGQNLAGANFCLATLAGTTFAGSNVSSANFTRANASGANFISAILAGTHMYSANLINADLTNADCQYVRFSGANVTSANFRGANLFNADLTDAIVVRTDFSKFSLSGTGITVGQLYSTASYKSGDLTGIGLSYNNLTGCDLAGQDLTEANLSGTILTDADFSNANLADADLRGAVGATLTGATLHNTIGPDGEILGLARGRNEETLLIRDNTQYPAYVNQDWTYAGRLVVYGSLNMNNHSLRVASGGSLVIGRDFNVSGSTFNVGGLDLRLATLEVINGVTATQNLGALFKVGNLDVEGTYHMAGGALVVGYFDDSSTGSLHVALGGVFSVTDKPAQIYIGKDMTVDGTFTAIKGTEIHMTGATLHIGSTAGGTGLANTAFYFEGGEDVVDTIFFAGGALNLGGLHITDGSNVIFDFMDMGTSTINIDGLTLGTGSTFAFVSDDGSSPTIHLTGLTLESGSSLDLGGNGVYCDKVINNGGSFSNGNLIVNTPEPGTIALIAPALLGFAGVAFGRLRRAG